MSFGLMRMRTISAGSVSDAEKHNAREYSEEELLQHPNIQPDGEGRQKYGPNMHYKKDELKLNDAINQRIKESGVKVRKNSAVAIEFVLALSPDVKKAYDDPKGYSADGMLHNLDNFIVEKFGMENVVSISHHFDESNPHSHIIVTPIKKKEIKWKNRSGTGSRIENRLVARDFIGTKEKLRNLQTEYYNHVKQWECKLPGITFYRGKDARERKKEYKPYTSQQLGEVREMIAKLEKMAQSEEKEVKIEKLKQSLAENITPKEKKPIFKQKDTQKSRETFKRFNPFSKQKNTQKRSKGMGM